MQDILVLLNARAGTMIDRGADGVRGAIRDALGGRGRNPDIRVLQPRELARAIGGIANSRHDTIVIGGGDGSVSAAAHALGGTDKTLGVLPFGTLNLLARDLNMPQEPHDAIAALAQARPRRIDLASINGRMFHSVSGLGFFSQMARAREEHRDLPGKILRVGAAAMRALTRTGRFSLEIETGGERRAIDTYALLVTCNRFDGEGWARNALDGGALFTFRASTSAASRAWRPSGGST